MKNPDYKFNFENIYNKNRTARLFYGRTGQEVKFDISLNDTSLLFNNLPIPSSLADILDLAAVTYAADRLSIRTDDMPISIHITLPVRNLPLFQNPMLHKALQETLRWYTEDIWYFDFVSKTNGRRLTEYQCQTSLFNESDLGEKVETALFSGGLDSLAGFCTRFSEDPSRTYVLVGTGANYQKFALQKRVFIKTTKILNPKAKLIQVPFGITSRGELAKNSTQRSRGFVFMLIGAVCATVAGTTSLSIYENGYGAINLPYRESEVGLDHSRAVHPLSLLRMSHLLSLLLDTDFKFENPFLFSTKAQMCEVFKKNLAQNIIFQTITCDSMHRKKPQQCGYCSSCLLRRQAIEACGIVDKTEYVATEQEFAIQPSYNLHLRAMLEQLQTFKEALQADSPWQTMTWEFPSLASIADQLPSHNQGNVERNLLNLYSTYLTEWQKVLPNIGRRLLTEEELAVYKDAI